jgi:hypothetical protein
MMAPIPATLLFLWPEIRSLRKPEIRSLPKMEKETASESPVWLQLVGLASVIAAFTGFYTVFLKPANLSDLLWNNTNRTWSEWEKELESDRKELAEMQAKEAKEEQKKHELPAFFNDDDRKFLVQALKGQNKEALNIQIIRREDDRCIKLADQFDSIFVDAGWKLVGPPMPAAPTANIDEGLVIESSLTSPASFAALTIEVAFDQVGISSIRKRDPNLRWFNYAILTISDR